LFAEGLLVGGLVDESIADMRRVMTDKYKIQF